MPRNAKPACLSVTLCRWQGSHSNILFVDIFLQVKCSDNPFSYAKCQLIMQRVRLIC